MENDLSRKATTVDSVPAVTERAIEVSAKLTAHDITKFRFKFGRQFIFLGLGSFLLGDFLPATKYFSDDFPRHAWIVAIIMFALGAAFSGKEVVESLAKAIKSFKSLSDVK